VRSAIRRRQYAGDTSRSDAELAIAAIDDESRRLVAHPVTSSVLELASALVDRQNLRALDSVQLASAILASQLMGEEDHFQFVVSDQRLLKAAIAEGIDAWDPSIA
jgi:predicted nucleic acid-binding protein